MRLTHTFATMEVSATTFAEIRRKLEEAGYSHAILHGDAVMLDMTGIALTADSTASTPPAAPDFLYAPASSGGLMGKESPPPPPKPRVVDVGVKFPLVPVANRVRGN